MVYLAHPLQKMTAMRKLFTLLVLTAVMELSYAQNVGIGTTTPQAKLDISSSTDGVLLPRVALTSTSNFAPLALSPTTSTLVYNTATAGSGTTAVTPGFYYWDGSQWIRIADAAASSKDWTIANTATSPAVTTSNQYVSGNVGIGNFSATTPSVALDVRTTDAVKLPNGTTAQRPLLPLAGATRFNSDLGVLEYYDGTQWQSVNAQVPIGTITSYGGSTPPPGWLLCDGSSQSTTGTYAALYAVIGYTYGGSGGTFSLPDLRGKAAFGLSGVAPYSSLGLSGGATSTTPTLTHNLQFPSSTINATLPNHVHTVPAHSHSFSLSTGTGTTGTEAAHTHVVPAQSFSTTDGAGAHQHNVGLRSNDGGYAAGNPNTFHYGMSSGGGGVSTSDRGATSNANTGIIISAGGHNHTINVPAITSNAGSAHSHSIPSLSVSGSIGTAGTSGDATFNSGNPTTTPNIPVTVPTTSISGSVTAPTINTYDPYQVVNYIIKASNVATAGITSVSLSSGTLGQTLYYNGSNWTPTSNLYNAGGNVGVGTTNPLTTLDVKGSQISSFTGTQKGTITDEASSYVNGNFTALDFINDAGNNPTARIASQANASGTKLYFGTSNSSGSGVTNSAMVINESGNVGIGTTSPANNLNVVNSSTSQAMNVDLSSTDALMQLKSSTTGSWARIGSNGSSLALLTQGSDKTATTNALVSMMILNTGSVGVATTSPSQKLEIGSNGGLGFSGTGLNATDKKLYSPADGDLEWMTNNAAGAHGFAISNQGTKTVYLNSSGSSYLNGGSVGIGTSGPLSKLDVSGGVAVGSYAGANAAPTNGLIVSGSLGVGTASPAYTVDVSGTMRATGTITNGGFDFILGTTDQSSRGNSGASRALVKDGGNVLDVNYGNDFTGGTRIGSLTNGTAGNRIVYSDNSGLLTNSPSNGMVAMLYGTINLGDVGGSFTPSSATGIVSGATRNYSSGSDASVTITLSQSISSYLPLITVMSVNPGSNTSSGGQWNADNDVFAIVGNIQTNSFDVYLREASSSTQNVAIIVGLMVRSY